MQPTFPAQPGSFQQGSNPAYAQFPPGAVPPPGSSGPGFPQGAMGGQYFPQQGAPQSQHAGQPIPAGMPPGQQQSAPSGNPPPPTGAFTEQGEPILFYVMALYDYTPDAAETGDLSMPQGSIVAVTSTEPDDGWWTGTIVGTDKRGLFPSNFVDFWR